MKVTVEIPAGKYCADCILLGERENHPITSYHRCRLLRERVYHLESHPRLNKHPDCPSLKENQNDNH